MSEYSYIMRCLEHIDRRESYPHWETWHGVEKRYLTNQAREIERNIRNAPHTPGTETTG